MERIHLFVKAFATTEQRISLIDKKGNYYHWITKNYKSPLFYSIGDEWFEVTATLIKSQSDYEQNRLKNIRILKSKKEKEK